MCALPSALAFLGTLVVSDPALAACPVADAKVEKAIATKPELRGGAGAQVARDLRTLRDAPAVERVAAVLAGEPVVIAPPKRESKPDPPASVSSSSRPAR